MRKLKNALKDEFLMIMFFKMIWILLRRFTRGGLDSTEVKTDLVKESAQLRDIPENNIATCIGFFASVDQLNDQFSIVEVYELLQRVSFIEAVLYVAFVFPENPQVVLQAVDQNRYRFIFLHSYNVAQILLSLSIFDYFTQQLNFSYVFLYLYELIELDLG